MSSSASTPGARHTSEVTPDRRAVNARAAEGPVATPFATQQQRTSTIPSRVRVTTAVQSGARDHAAIAAGIPSFALMLRAGTHAAEVILRDMDERVQHGVALFAGVGNNGGDTYIVAAQLARAGIRVRLHAAGAPRTADAQRAARLAAPFLVDGAPTGRERAVVDGLLGTGHAGALRGDITAACETLSDARARGATIVALDVPSGLNASTGEISDGAVAADVTVTFGTIKRGLLIARAYAGRVVLADIGLEHHAAAPDDAWIMPDDAMLARMLPSIAWDAYKSRRGQLALVGGAVGMAGAVVLASRAALRTGAGLVHNWIDIASVPVLQATVPQAIAHDWPDSFAPAADVTHDVRSDTVHADASDSPWGSALAIGPGLGRDQRSRALLALALQQNAHVPLLLDADALTLLSSHANAKPKSVSPSAADHHGDVAASLRVLSANGRVIVCTPHPGEFARMLGVAVPTDWQQRAEVLREFASRAAVTVLLKGTPTLIAPADGGPLVVMARGTAALATGGSGDVLSGIIGALLAQGLDGPSAAILGATAHGLAAERATTLADGEIRGVTLEDVLDALPHAWQQLRQFPTLSPGVLYELPANGRMA